VERFEEINQEKPFDGLEDNVDYLRFGNVKFNPQSLVSTYQELRLIFSFA